MVLIPLDLPMLPLLALAVLMLDPVSVKMAPIVA
jgi:hypothetical protein